MQSDLDQKTKDRNWQIVISYFGDIEALIAQAKQGFRGHSEEKKQRNAALIETLAFIGMRRSELLGLGVTDVDYERTDHHDKARQRAEGWRHPDDRKNCYTTLINVQR